MVLVYEDKMSAVYSPTGGFGVWNEWDLTSRGVPGNCVAEILVEYPGADGDGDLEAYAGVREKGSSLSRTLAISPYRSTDLMATFRVNVDADGVIEAHDNAQLHVPHCSFRVIGWLKGATYTETYIALNEDDGVWDDDDLFTDHGVPKGSVCDIAMGNKDGGAQEIGIREFGTTGFKYKMNDVPYTQGYSWVNVWCKTNSDGKIEFYTDDASEAQGKCMGYWDQSVDYTTVNAVVVPAGASSWQNHNLGGLGVIKNSIPCIVAFNREANTVNLCGVREDAGSAWSRFRNVDEGFNDTHACCLSMCVRAITDNETVELYTSDLADAWFYLDGYLRSKYPLAKINGVAIADLAKINGVPIDDIAGVNGYPI